RRLAGRRPERERRCQHPRQYADNRDPRADHANALRRMERGIHAASPWDFSGRWITKSTHQMLSPVKRYECRAPGENFGGGQFFWMNCFLTNARHDSCNKKFL